MNNKLKSAYIVLYRNSDRPWSRVITMGSLKEAQDLYDQVKAKHSHARLVATNVREDESVEDVNRSVGQELLTGSWNPKWVTLEIHNKPTGRELLFSRIPQYFEGKSYTVFNCAADSSCLFIRVDRGDDEYSNHFMEIVGDENVRVTQV